MLSKFCISNELLHDPTPINRLTRVDKAVRISNECHRVCFSFYPRDFEIFTEAYTLRTDFLPKSLSSGCKQMALLVLTSMEQLSLTCAFI